jgi:hypothetical protein
METTHITIPLTHTGGRQEWRPYEIYIVLVILTLIGAGLRLAYINRPIYTDEAYTYLYFIRDGLGDVLTDYREPNNHIFQTIFAWLSVTVFGNQPFALRIPALISGVLLIPATFTAGSRLYNPRAGLMAAGLVTVSVPLAEYAVSARGYSFIALFFALLVILAHDLKTANVRWKWFAYGVVAALGLYTVPIMLYPLGSVSLWLVVSLLIEKRGRERWLSLRDMVITLSGAALLTLLLYTPIITHNGFDAVTGNRFVASLSAAEFRSTVINFPGDFVAFVSQGVPDAVHLVLIGFAALSLVVHYRISRDRVPLIIPTVIWLTLLVVVQYVLPPIRTWIFLVVLYPLLAGAGLSVVMDWLEAQFYMDRAYFLVLGAIVGGILAGMLLTDAMNHTVTYKRENDAQAVAAFLAERLQPDDRILLTNGAIHNFEYYLDYYGQPFDIIYLSTGHDDALHTAESATLYVLTRVGDPHVEKRVLESIGVDLAAGEAELVPLAEMPGGEMVVNRLVVGG